MELIYLWSQDYRNLKNIGFNFSNKFEVNYYEKSLSICNENEINLFQNTKNLLNITAIIGKNGTGKSNILNLIGMRRHERIRHIGRYSYYLLYHFDSNIYVIEGININLIKDLILNFEEIGFIKDPYSLIFEYRNGKFYFLNFLQMSSDVFKKNQIYTYKITYDKELAAYGDSYETSLEYTAYFNRIYLSHKNTGVFAKYLMLIKLKNQNYNKIFNIPAKINVYIKSSFNEFLEDDLEIPEYFNGLSFLNRNNFPKYDKKTDFINKMIYKMCQKIAHWVFNSKEDLDLYSLKLKEVISKNNLFEFEKHYVLDCLRIIKFLLLLKDKNDIFGNKVDLINNTISEYFISLKGIQPEYFHEREIIIPIKTYENIFLSSLLQKMNELNRMDAELAELLSVFEVTFDTLSSGEQAMINLFSSLNFGLCLEEFTNNSLNKTAIILLDEPDVYMHPEWSRCLVNEIITFLETQKTNYDNYQIILTTHSPLLISDIPNSNVIALSRDEETDSTYQLELDETFANNIHTLLSRDFFVSSTLGEYAKKRINEGKPEI